MNRTFEPEERAVRLAMGPVCLEGTLASPPHPEGLVLFAHGSGSGRHSPRNQQVARSLREGGLATLLFDLLTPEEDRVYSTRFDLNLLKERLAGAVERIQEEEAAPGLPLGLFGASTGAAAALLVAADLGESIQAVVARGGRTDLAGDAQEQVRCPTLLIVGGDDHPVLEINRGSYCRLRGVKELVVIPGASHLFEEEGALEEVSRLAREWFRRFLPRRPEVMNTEGGHHEHRPG